MRIDNSAFSAFWTCPEKYRLAFQVGLRKDFTYFEFGTYFHTLLICHYKPPEMPTHLVSETMPSDSKVQSEVESMFEAYKAAYPVEPFEVLECERSFELPIPGTDHTYLGKIDMIVRDHETKALQVFETKTESRFSKRNLPEAWTARTQGSLYAWAASELYREPVDSILLNICTKASPKGQIGPSFRRDVLQRTPEQIQEALESLIYVCDRLQDLEFEYPRSHYPRNKNACVNELSYRCDFYSLCNYGDTPETRSQFVIIKPYSHLEM